MQKVILERYKIRPMPRFELHTAHTSCFSALNHSATLPTRAPDLAVAHQQSLFNAVIRHQHALINS